jgi:ADP-heptose:LPS heptosyltransferase
VAVSPWLLAYRALGLGDFLTALPALRGLRRARPEHRIVLAAPQAIAPLAELSGAVDEVHDSEPLLPLPAELCHAPLAVNLHGCGPQSHRRLLEAKPERLIAFARGDLGVDGPEWDADEHEVRRWCRLLECAGIPADPAELDLPAPPGTAATHATVIHPGAASGARRWPAERWGAVARAERAAGRDVRITGSPGETGLARAVADQAGLDDSAVLAGRTSLVELARVVAGAARVLSGDTGIAHLATALRTPSVVLFGPTPPGLWGPPPDRPWHRVLWAGHIGDPHASEPDPGLLAIGVSDVLAELGRLDARVEQAA